MIEYEWKKHNFNGSYTKYGVGTYKEEGKWIPSFKVQSSEKEDQEYSSEMLDIEFDSYDTQTEALNIAELEVIDFIENPKNRSTYGL